MGRRLGIVYQASRRSIPAGGAQLHGQVIFGWIFAHDKKPLTRGEGLGFVERLCYSPLHKVP
ncbi:hypothetical protein HMPREF9080_02023 [Cardiobacterium valvarum F0432]|uniref:Uncharacterized protein n=1 Tax=Cardiobacterium valvarum F0432 TaxID=797473 RepID=G9ZGW6_9GAMM|nr:hypothetical protein HMPREF9080_02023 [Cardiobacterium valvarum F0432]